MVGARTSRTSRRLDARDEEQVARRRFVTGRGTSTRRAPPPAPQHQQQPEGGPVHHQPDTDPAAEQRRVEDGIAAVCRAWLTRHGYAHPAPRTVPVDVVLGHLARLERTAPTDRRGTVRTGWRKALTTVRATVIELAGGATDA